MQRGTGWVLLVLLLLVVLMLVLLLGGLFGREGRGSGRIWAQRGVGVFGGVFGGGLGRVWGGRGATW